MGANKWLHAMRRRGLLQVLFHVVPLAGPVYWAILSFKCDFPSMWVRDKVSAPTLFDSILNRLMVRSMDVLHLVMVPFANRN